MGMHEIRRMNQSDVKSVTLIHLKSFPGFFLTFMGGAFLERFYAATISDETHIAFVSLQDEKITGFVVGTTEPRGFYKRLLFRFGGRFLFASIRPVLNHPITILRLFNRLLSSTGTQYAPDEALLMSIAVLPECEGHGLGRALIAAFVKEACNRQIKKVYLTTDKNNNERVNLFYQKIGFDQVRSFITSEGREMNEYRFSVT
jgi:ribosomal protein S18 acetylase RimI-like enzyme